MINRIVIGIAVATACSHGDAPTDTTRGGSDVTKTSTCRDAIRQISARDLATWTGLPACSVDELVKAFPPAAEGERRTILGSDLVAVATRMLRAPGYAEPLEVSAAGTRVVRIDAIRPELVGTAESLTHALGEPAAKLPYYNDVIRLPDAEWVWPSRGLALYLNRDHRFVLRFALFAATDLATYQRTLEPNLQVHER
jgi:hypothetical protein